MNKWLFVFISIVILAGMNLPAQNPYIQQFTTQDGLPSNNVYLVMQDHNNFIWFGTDAGVARYDGNEFTCFSKKDGLSSNEIIYIKEDSQGRIWFTNLGGSMNYYYQNKIYNSQNAPFLDSLQSRYFFRGFYEDTDLSLYFYSLKSREIVALNAQNEVKRYPLPAITFVWDGLKNVGPSILNITKSREDGFVLWTTAGVIAFHDF
jgi:ligand-binding sensor domain-containing protein